MSDYERPGATESGEEGDREPGSLVRHDEELRVGRASREAGSVHVRKDVESRNVEELVPLRVEHFHEVEKREPNEQDSGEIETLPDGSISIPVLEEELLVTKRTVVRERVVIRKRTETEERRVEAELRKERVEVDADPGADVQGEPE
jgi:uncharacterized protein (TIGR02271 family)